MAKRFFLGVFCVLLVGLTGQCQPTQLPDAVASARQGIPLAVKGNTSFLNNLVYKAFSVHGAFVLNSRGKAAYQVVLAEVNGTAVRVSVTSATGSQTKILSGANLNEAGRRACDWVVRLTTGQPGFFAGKLAFVGESTGHKELWESDVLFAKARALTQDRSDAIHPKWSPDGKRLLYTTYFRSGFPDIWAFDTKSFRRIPFATYKGTNTGGVFSPDGKRTAMILSYGGSLELVVADKRGESKQRLTRNKSLESAPCWSPDGSKLVFTSDAAGKPQLFIIGAAGGTPRRIQTGLSGYLDQASWNKRFPNLIAFSASVSGNYQIGVYDLDKGQGQILTSGRKNSVEPCWTNDGRHLIFTEKSTGRSRICVLDTVTKKVAVLSSPKFGQTSQADFILVD